MEILHQYNNGNTKVSVYNDGTKIREYSGEPKPIHPESCDVKITSYCDLGCKFCHERSSLSGKRADLDKLLGVLSVLPAGVEIAIGGGNAFSHPGLVPFLHTLKARGNVANITINHKHIKQYKEILNQIIDQKLIHGICISCISLSKTEDILNLLKKSDNIVFHLIMGLNSVEDIDKLNDICLSLEKKCKVLVLGYKEFGFGEEYFADNEHKIEASKYLWYTKLASRFKSTNLVISFDNLAISQLNLNRYFTNESWEKFYMGDDFVFTMYIDGVEETFASSSTARIRAKFSDISLLNYFQKN